MGSSFDLKWSTIATRILKSQDNFSMTWECCCRWRFHYNLTRSAFDVGRYVVLQQHCQKQTMDSPLCSSIQIAETEEVGYCCNSPAFPPRIFEIPISLISLITPLSFRRLRIPMPLGNFPMTYTIATPFNYIPLCDGYSKNKFILRLISAGQRQNFLDEPVEDQ